MLKDDRNFFPEYQAVSFYTVSLPEKAKQLLAKLTGKLSEEEMQQLNARALFDKKGHREIAEEFLLSKKMICARSEASM